MSVVSSIENWFAKFKPYLFANKQGFYELQYLANSPEAMIGAFKKIPFVKVDNKKQSITANTPFLKVLFYYREIEAGFFILCSETRFKANVSFRHYYDKSIPADYFCLSLRHHQDKVVNSIMNSSIFPDDSWVLLKPEAKAIHHHFKGTTGRYISVYFTQLWLDNYLQDSSKEARKIWEIFIQSGCDNLICPHLNGTTVFDERVLFDLLFSSDKFNAATYTETLRRETLNLLHFFTSKMVDEQITERHFLVSNQDRGLALIVRQRLKEQLYNKFPGIEALAIGVGISETKLKESFKTIYNQTIFQYFQSLQMTKAKEILLNSDTPISKLANTFSYENASKFSSAFKEFHGCLPSEIKKAG
jgi:AraC-like DNA-binding protein